MGTALRTTLFGESHGPAVGALIEGMPPGTPIDEAQLAADLQARRPGGRYASRRAESDQAQLLSGIHQGCATGYPILVLVRNEDARTKDYSFLPDHPRPGHADLPMMRGTAGHADLRGGGSASARLTLGLVASGSLARPILGDIRVLAHVHSIGEVIADPSVPVESPLHDEIRCRDPKASRRMMDLIDDVRRDRDSIGSSVEVRIEGLPIGFGAPWFSGIEPALAHALMAIPGARALEFGHGIAAGQARGSEHNSSWEGDPESPSMGGLTPDGALGGFATGAPVIARLTLKPPSSIPRAQRTLNLASGEEEDLIVRGRHDPVLAPRAVAVVEAVARLVVADLALMRGRGT